MNRTETIQCWWANPLRLLVGESLTVVGGGIPYGCWWGNPLRCRWGIPLRCPPIPRDLATNSTMKYLNLSTSKKRASARFFEVDTFWMFQQLNLLQHLGAFLPPSHTVVQHLGGGIPLVLVGDSLTVLIGESLTVVGGRIPYGCWWGNP